MTNRERIAALEEKVETLAQQLSEIFTDGEARPFLVADVISRAASLTGVARSEIIGQFRQRRIVRARFAVIWVARKVSGMSMPQIGQRLGDRDHTSVLYAYQRAAELRSTDAAFKKLTDLLLAPYQAKETAQ